jgi:hypothetical protein
MPGWLIGLCVSLYVIAIVLIGDVIEWLFKGPAPLDRTIAPWLLGGWVI